MVIGASVVACGFFENMRPSRRIRGPHRPIQAIVHPKIDFKGILISDLKPDVDEVLAN